MGSRQNLVRVEDLLRNRIARGIQCVNEDVAGGVRDADEPMRRVIAVSKIRVVWPRQSAQLPRCVVSEGSNPLRLRARR